MPQGDLSISSIPNPSVLQLPAEVTEGILSEIDDHSDLIALALTSPAFTNLIIPQHTEYRIIRTRHFVTDIWAHLARRADLTQNIREVHLCTRHDRTATDRYPTTLLDTDLDGKRKAVLELNGLNDLCQAIGHMKRLRVFTWAHAWSNKHRSGVCIPIIEDRILGVLNRAPSLRHLALSGEFGIHVRGGTSPEGTPYPAWNFSNLLSLSLEGDCWVKPSNAPHVCRMMKLSPDLEHLELPMDFSQLKELHFQRLKRLKLPLQSGGTPVTDLSCTAFLENHPTIEELCWHPIGDISFSPSILPSLKRLASGEEVLTALEKTDCPRSIECLSIRSLCPEKLFATENVDRASLRKLSLHNNAISSLNNIYHLANLANSFSAITWLSVSFYLQYTDPLPLFHMLSCFRNLEVLRGPGIWSAVHNNNDAIHLAIMKLVQLCPKLRQLDHHKYSMSRREAKRIIIIREGLEGENVRYEVQRPPPWKPFDVTGREFD